MRRLAVTLGVIVIAVAGLLPSPFVTVSPGPVIPLGEVVAFRDRAGPPTPIHLVAVVAREVTWYGALKGALEREVAVLDSAALWGGNSPEEFAGEMERLMDESRSLALNLAAASVGLPEAPDLEVVIVKNSEVLGPSAGLALALQFASALSGEDLAGGLRVAATGVLDASGRVSGVGGIAQKAISCKEQGMDLFLVPATNYEEAVENAPGVEVVAVRSLAEALEAVRRAARSNP